MGFVDGVLHIFTTCTQACILHVHFSQGEYVAGGWHIPGADPNHTGKDPDNRPAVPRLHLQYTADCCKRSGNPSPW
jgi:hypothetical protein